MFLHSYCHFHVNLYLVFPEWYVTIDRKLEMCTLKLHLLAEMKQVRGSWILQFLKPVFCTKHFSLSFPLVIFGCPSKGKRSAKKIMFKWCTLVTEYLILRTMPIRHFDTERKFGKTVYLWRRTSKNDVEQELFAVHWQCWHRRVSLAICWI